MVVTWKRLLAIIGVLFLFSGCRSQSLSMTVARTPVENTAIGTATWFDRNTRTPTSTNSPQATNTFTVEIPPTEAKHSPTDAAPVDLAFVGDIMLGRSLAQKISDGKGDEIFTSVRTVLESADLAVGNLECAIGTDGKKAVKGYTFLAPPSSVAVLKGAGFDLLSLANNHSLDYGSGVLGQTRQLLTGSGMQVVGAGENAAQARAPVGFEIHGLRLAFLAYAEVPVERGGFDARSWTAGDSTPGISWANDDEIISDLQTLRSRADYIVVLFHFGVEGSTTPSVRQVELSHLAVDNGADFVVGSHPHLLQKEETYKNRWIFYSMGNFVFDDFSGSYNHSAILRVTISPKEAVTYSLIPVILVNGIPILGHS